MRNAWSLWESESPLYKDINKRFGLTHADDMSAMIYKCAWQTLNGFAPTPQFFASRYLSYWIKAEKEGKVVLDIDGIQEESELKASGLLKELVGYLWMSSRDGEATIPDELVERVESFLATLPPE
jgi:hypothetical protein